VELTDQQHFDALASGDITAFEMYFKSFYQPLCSYAYTFLHDKDEAEEIVQSTFLSVWEKREILKIHTSGKSYMYAMVRNACLNVIKHEKIKQKYVGEEIALAQPGYESVAQTMASTELETRIQAAIGKLPEQCRLVFKLSRFEELKYTEIAEQLDISVKTVENHMGKALKMMREQLKDYLPLLIAMINACMIAMELFGNELG
jgi:RNA polymerase sigma-70 factor, ECF subfamily